MTQPHATNGSNVREARSLSGQGLRFNLREVADEFRRELGRLSAGRAAKTLVKAGTLRATLVRRRAGVRLDPEAAAGEATVHVLESRVRLQADDRVLELGPGELVAPSRNLREPLEATEESVLLITLACREGAGAWDEEERQGHY